MTDRIWKFPLDAIGTADIADDAVTNPKLANMPAATVKARASIGAGDPEDIAVVSPLGINLIDGLHLTPNGVTSLELADNAVTMAKLANLTTDTLIGRDAAGTGDPEPITLGASLSFSGAGTIQRAALTGDVTAAANGNATTIANSAVTLAKMANIASQTILGNNTGGAAAPIALTVAQLISMLDAALLGLLSAAAAATTKGALLAFDGTVWGCFDGDAGADTRHLEADSTETLGVKWDAP